jgi:hypothetical protein
MPEAQPARRRFLNQRLSELRAKMIGEYITQMLKQAQQGTPPPQIQQDLVGLGEELPAGLKSPYPLSDPRRRICKVNAYIMKR